MSIFDSIAKTFAPRSKAPTIATLEALEAEAATAVGAARVALEAIEAARADAVLQGETARAAHRAKLTAARDDLEDAEAALGAVRERLDSARQAATENGRRERYHAAVAAQAAAERALRESYTPAVETLRALQRQVAAADELARAANENLPAGAERLIETEAVRDVPATPERILGEETTDAWVTTEGGAPVDAARVTRREGRKGFMYAESSFGPRPVACQLVKMRRVTRQPWCPPSYASRIADLILPDLHAAPVPAPATVSELLPLAGTAEAAE